MSVASIASGWFDLGEGFDVKICNRFEHACGGASMQAFWERLEPFGILGLRCEEFGHGIAPSLGTAPPIGGVAWVRGGRDRRCQAGTRSGLTLGAAESMLALWPAATRHGFGLRYVTQSRGIAAPVGHSLLFAVGEGPPHDGVRRLRRHNLFHDLAALRRASSGLSTRLPRPSALRERPGSALLRWKLEPLVS